jgi:hypothetical protein
MENRDGDGPKVVLKGARAKSGTSRQSSLARAFARAFALPTPVEAVEGIIIVPLSNLLKLAFPPLWVSSLPRKAIGFSLPRGNEGKLLGASIIAATSLIALLAAESFGAVALLGIVWLTGGTGVLMVYNSTRQGVAFVKHMCSTCRLRPIIEEHEIMHLRGEPSEEVVWRETLKKYTYDGLELGTDPKIHSFCPIAKRLKENP